MGADIHCFVEYKSKDSTDWFNWGDRFHLDRNYAVFAALAGVRGQLPKGGVKPRGVPEDMGYMVHGRYWLYVTTDGIFSRANDGEGGLADASLNLMVACLNNPDDDAPRQMLLDELQTWHEAASKGKAYYYRAGGCGGKDAASWVKGKLSVYLNSAEEYVSHPDYHTPTWLTPAEWEWALKKAGGSLYEYYALLAAMRSLESAKHEVRVVAWFDN